MERQREGERERERERECANAQRRAWLLGGVGFGLALAGPLQPPARPLGWRAWPEEGSSEPEVPNKGWQDWIPRALGPASPSLTSTLSLLGGDKEGSGGGLPPSSFACHLVHL